MELLLYASGEHQIIEAIKLLGVSPSTTELVVVGLSETKPDLEQLQDIIVKTVNAAPDDTVIDIERPNRKNDLKKAYKISDKELNSSRMPGETESEVLKKLVIERSALLALEH
jgi:tRNA threonylcarbamoyladenosine modification (KEOPS) complex Cgi121 subunit